MSVLTWLPRDVREHLTDLDPARDAEPADLPAVAELIFDEDGRRLAVRRSTVVDIGPRRIRRVRWIAPLAAVAVVAVLAGGVALVRVFEEPPTVMPAIGGVGGAAAVGHGSGPSATSTARSPAAIAALWAGFPVGASPRPVILLGEDVDPPATGFPDGDSKIAFMAGQVTLDLPVPTPPGAVHGYPVLSAPAALALLKPTQPIGVQTQRTLRVSAIELVEHPFLTDRGNQSLPAWKVQLSGARDPAYILALAPSALYAPPNAASADSGGAVATLGADRRSLTVSYVSRFVSSDPCNPSYTSGLQLVQTATAVVVAISIKDDPLPAATRTPSGGSTIFACGLTGVAPPTGPFTPGEPNTRTITLAQPLGNRVVVDGGGNPYEVTAP